MNYQVTIGLEIHSTVDSKRKMFSKAWNNATASENTCVDWLDLGLPGTLPVINLQVVHKAIQLAHMLKMQIHYDKIAFDRKNYFYYDLPKGYQITQYFHPIATNGQIDLVTNQKTIRIKQIQIEEDTAKQTTENQYLKLDYNRSGTPLLEIVTEADFHNSAEVLEFLSHLKRTLVFTNISDGKIELGNLRVDVNISLAPLNATKLNNKVEIKNIGSFSAVESAINFEILRQSALLDQNEVVQQETRRWDESSGQTIFMRQKSDVVGYYFMPEPNLPIFSLNQNEFEQIIAKTPTDWSTIATNLKAHELTDAEVNNLLDHYGLYLAVETINQTLNNYKKSYKWLAIEILGYLNKANLEWENLSGEQQAQLLKAIVAVEVDKKLNGKQIKLVFEAIIQNHWTLEQAVKHYQLEQITDLATLEAIVTEILSDNAANLAKFTDNAVKFEKFIIGQIMARTKAQANPLVAKQAYLNQAAYLLTIKSDN